MISRREGDCQLSYILISKFERKVKYILRLKKKFYFRYRDIHIAAWGFKKDTHKAAGLQLKWDANRDPNQKLAIAVDFLNPEPYDYKGNFIVSYPGRSISGAFDFLLKGEEM